MSQRSSFVSPANSFFYKRPISNFALQTTQISSFFLHTNNKFQFQRRFLTTTETQKTTKEVTPDDNVKIAREKAKNKFYNPAIEYYLKAIEGYIKGNDVIAANKLKFEIACANMELFQKEVETQQKLGAKLKDQFYRSEALKQFRSFLSTQTENPDNYRVAQSHYLIGNLHAYFTEEIAQAKENYEKSIQLCDKITNLEMKWRILVPATNALVNLILNNSDIPNKQLAVSLLDKLVEEAQSITDLNIKFSILYSALVTGLGASVKLLNRTSFDKYSSLLLENSKFNDATMMEALLHISSSKLELSMKLQEEGDFDCDLGVDDAKQALDLARKLKGSEYLCRANFQLGKAYTEISKHRSDAKEALNEALAHADSLGAQFKSLIYVSLGKLYSFDEISDEAINHYNLALESVDQKNFSLLEEIHSNIAQLYQRTENPFFIEHLIKSGEFATKGGNPDKEWEINLYLGNWYQKNNQHDKALSMMISVLSLIQNAMKFSNSKLHGEDVGPWPDVCSGILEACTSKLYHPKLQKNFVKRVLLKLREIQEATPTAFPKANDYCVVVIDRHIENVEKMEGVTWKS